jgi:serine/threonine protein kinase
MGRAAGGGSAAAGGSAVGDYTKGRFLSKGAFGQAFLAKCNRSGKDFVIKMVDISRCDQKERDSGKGRAGVRARGLARARACVRACARAGRGRSPPSSHWASCAAPLLHSAARKECAILGSLKHPNIIEYRESFEDKGQLCIVMAFAEGGDLTGLLKSRRGKLLDEEQIVDWFVQICLALKHVHDRKILHRDLKSQNIFLTARQKVPESFSRVRASACAIVHRALSVCLRLSTPIS